LKSLGAASKPNLRSSFSAQPSNLRDPALAQKVLWMSEGILGEIHEVLKRSAVQAIKDKSEKITLDGVAKIRWTMPSKRKTAPPPT